MESELRTFNTPTQQSDKTEHLCQAEVSNQYSLSTKNGNPEGLKNKSCN